MLSIKRDPIYKNKLFLSSLAVVSGFVMTVGIIRAVNPTDTSEQAAQTTDRRSSGLIPINASTAESSSETKDSGTQNEGATGTSSDAPQSTQPVSPMPAHSGTAARQSQTPAAPTQQPATPSQPQQQPSPAPSQPSDPACTEVLDVLGVPLVCL